MLADLFMDRTDIVACAIEVDLPSMRSASGSALPVWPWCVAAGSLSLLSAALLSSVTLNLTGDGWAYWQAAVSLLDGHGYRYFSGEPIVTWPPLYSIYLAAWMWLTGPTSVSVAYGNVVLLCLQAALWTWCLLRLWQQTEAEPSTISRVIVVIYLGLFLPLNQYLVRAELLFNVLLAPTLYYAWRAATASSTRGYRLAALCGLFGSLLIATHHRGAIFVVASAAVIASRSLSSHADRRMALVGAATALSIPAATWLLIRWALVQWDSHVTGLAVSSDGPIEHGRQFVRSLGELLSSSVAITPRWAVLMWAAAFVLVIARRIAPRPLAFGGGFTAAATALTFVTFSVTALDDNLDPRFILFIPLITVPLLLFALDQLRTGIGLVVGVVILVPLIGASVDTVIMTRGAAADPRETVVHPTEISSRYLSGPPVKTARGWLIVPTTWHEADAHVRSHRLQPLQ